MKKILPVLAAFLILLTLPVHAAAGKLTATSAVSGDQVTVTVRLDNPGIIATMIHVKYDSAVLQLTGVKNGEVFPQSSATFGRDYSNNPYTVLWEESTRRDNNTTSGTLFTATFTVKGGAPDGKTTVSVVADRASTFDVDLQNVQVAGGSCTVNVPVAASSASQTTTAPKKPDTTTAAKTPSGTTAATTTTTKAQPSVTAPKPTLTSPAQTTPTTKASGSAGQTTTQTTTASASTTGASTSAASTAAGSATAGQETTAGDAEPQTSFAQATPDGETVPASDDALPTESWTQPEVMIDPIPPTNHRNLLWLLLLIPAAVVVILIVKKKK